MFQSPLVDSGQVEALHWVFIKKDIVAGVGVGTGSGSLVFDGQVAVVRDSTGLLILHAWSSGGDGCCCVGCGDQLWVLWAGGGSLIFFLGS